MKKRKATKCREPKRKISGKPMSIDEILEKCVLKYGIAQKIYLDDNKIYRCEV